MLSWVCGHAAAPAGEEVSAVLKYKIGNSQVNPEYRSNSAAIEVLDNVFSDHAVLPLIEVTVSSSPDGVYGSNLRLARERADAVVGFLKERYPSLSDSILTVKRIIAEDWEGVDRYLQSTEKPWKDQALQIVRYGGNNRKEKLQDLWAGEAWDDLVKNAFPSLRRAVVRVVLPERAYSQTDFLFRRGYRQLDVNYAGNSNVIESLRQKIAEGYNGGIVLTGHHSPDGSAAANEKLSLARARIVKEYLVNELGYPDEKIDIVSGGTDWEKFASAAEYSYCGPDRTRVLSILRNNDLSSVAKKQQLLSLRGGETWKKLKENQMLRLCSVSVSYNNQEPGLVPDNNKDDAGQIEEPEKITVQESVVFTEEEKVQEQVEEQKTETIIETEKIEEKPVSKEITESVPPIITPLPCKKALFGVGSNILFDLATAVNASIEILVGKHWGITADAIFPWWKNRNANLAFQIMHFDIGARYYFKPWEQRNQDVFRGWFASASAGAGMYDIALWNPTGIQGEEIKLSVGGGYTVAIGNWWRMTAELGVGPIFTKYRVYEAEAPDRLVFKGNYSKAIPSPTTAKISLTYLLHR